MSPVDENLRFSPPNPPYLCKKTPSTTSPQNKPTESESANPLIKTIRLINLINIINLTPLCLFINIPYLFHFFASHNQLKISKIPPHSLGEAVKRLG